MIASVLVLQSLEGLSDRDAVQALATDLRWKVACGLSTTDAGFHPTTLTQRRNRLRKSDGPAGIKLLAGEPVGLDVLADSAYGSGDSLAALDNADHQILIKPWPLGRNSKLDDDQFNRDDFTIDYTARTVTCPNSITTHISQTGIATFGAKCRGCPVRSRCTSAIDGKAFLVSDHDQHLAANRQRWRTDTALIDDYRQHRPMVERTIAWLVTNRHRRLRYRGVDRNKIAFSTRAAVINLKRLIRLGHGHDGNTWNLAPA